ncbi:hypothetical protein GCM10010978_14680 [Compostibacillus humi]|jgi:hypothetical protein|uniref:Uncharacterized protein n=1 Tax=Compostibacillus humi TaxID=1245525 RepID=A0A8J3EK72_9BACI|nr:hypothetical protein [Compostibacillus humi]GGH75134.1 hypothetical protein GCM10010978_14680 [Compostibacillus humi]
MAKNREKPTAKIFSNDALRGKPYLDIDRVIDAGKSKSKSARE